MKVYNMRKVFIPGGFPTITYIDRSERKLEQRVEQVSRGLYKLVVVTGPTKSGKTVLVHHIFPRDKSVWIDGGAVETEEAFWEEIVDKLELFTSFSTVQSKSGSNLIGGKFSATGNVVVAKGELEGNAQIATSEQYSTTKSRQRSSKFTAINGLEKANIALVIDDFHYIDKSIQKAIIRALKAPIMNGLPVVFIAIPNRKYDAVEVEREMTGRIENIEMPVWTVQELSEIADQGFKALNVDVSPRLINILSESAYGSPFLMQEFCQNICEQSGIENTEVQKTQIDENINLTNIFEGIAEHSGRSIFNKLKRGPRARSDRKQRKLRNGSTTDIYGVVMEALKDIKPGVETVTYEKLRNHIRDILEEGLPQKNEISRVLDQAAKISYTDTSSTPVIDWDKENNLLTVTDPFFAFFLKWSRDD